MLNSLIDLAVYESLWNITEILLGDEIVGRELFLRRPRWSDADEVIAICREPDISVFTRVPPNYQREDFEKFLIAVEKTFTERSGAEYLIRESVDGPVLGAVGISAKERHAEAGYYLSSRARGKGGSNSSS